MNVEYKITNSIEEFKNFQGPKLNYSGSKIDSELFIESDNFLFENFIEPRNITVFEWKNNGAFFKTSDKSDIPFDLFAASFFLISRYEEYLPFKPDKHGRFNAENSFLFINNLLHKPIVNIWTEQFKQIILYRYPDLVFPSIPYKYISTFDLDNVFCYKGKSLYRNAGGAIKSLIKFDFHKIAERINVLSGKLNDPFDHYDYQRKVIEEYDIPAIYFFLFSRKTRFDGNVSPKSNAYKTLIYSIKEYAEIGIHPSYFSNENITLLKNEISKLCEASYSGITKSRQHFLKLFFPHTYRNLINSGIKEDYSMGYESQTGFRAGVCTPFNFYDLAHENETHLKIFPFCIMDSVFFDYMKISADKAFQNMKKIIDEVKSVNGTLISIWHDRTFSNTGIYEGWKEIFCETSKLASKKNNTHQHQLPDNSKFIGFTVTSC